MYQTAFHLEVLVRDKERCQDIPSHTHMLARAHGPNVQTMRYRCDTTCRTAQVAECMMEVGFLHPRYLMSHPYLKGVVVKLKRERWERESKEVHSIISLVLPLHGTHIP